MAINSVGSSAEMATPNVNLLGKLQSQLESNVANATQKAKQDSLFLSENAKDLMAQQNGTIVKEEQSETQTVKTKESFAD